jgi:DNA-binding XRE family transcriptional regulator
MCEDLCRKETKMTVGEKIKKLREEKGITQNKLAEKIGANHSVICHWEKGNCEPSLFNCICLADYFGIKKSDLVEDVNVGKETISNQEQVILDLFHKVPDEKKEFLIKMIQAVIDNQ